ncbi:MAG TPA: 3-oxoadipate enol-lactonase [Aldersonia sp.]
MSTTAVLHYEERGNPDGPALVLLGSLGSDLSMWTPQLIALADRFRLVAIDHRGHGKSEVPPGPYTVADLAGDTLAVLDSLAIDSAHFVGLSLGGAVSQWLAIHHQDRVRTLTLLCTAANFAPSQAWTDRAATVRADGVDSIADAIVDRWFSPHLTARDSEFVAAHRQMIAATPDEGYAGCCEALATFDARPDLARIVAPTLVIAGAVDPATPPDLMRSQLADQITGAKFHVLDPGAHLVSAEQAGPVSALIAEHAGGAEARSAAHDAGMRVRRSVLGDAHVDRAVEGTTEFTAPFQDFITRTAWGDIWNRPGLDHRTRRLLTLAVLTAVGNEHELDMHIRAALRAGLDPDDLVEVFLHTAVYAGVPNSNRAFALGKAALAEIDPAESTP